MQTCVSFDVSISFIWSAFSMMMRMMKRRLGGRKRNLEVEDSSLKKLKSTMKSKTMRNGRKVQRNSSRRPAELAEGQPSSTMNSVAAMETDIVIDDFKQCSTGNPTKLKITTEGNMLTRVRHMDSVGIKAISSLTMTSPSKPSSQASSELLLLTFHGSLCLLLIYRMCARNEKRAIIDATNVRILVYDHFAEIQCFGWSAVGRVRKNRPCFK